jgi:hypothetical protein
MANTVRKGAGRAAAAERKNRHAQRTTLPPRGKKVADAKVVIDSLSTLAHGEGSDPKSLGKAQAFAEKAVAAKWNVAIAPRGEAVELTATRGPEILIQAWSKGVWQYDASTYAFADRTTKPRNASGALKLLERATEVAQEETSKVNSNNAFRRREPKELQTIVLPLDPAVLTDEEATKYFQGRTVRWYNRQSRNAETATVSRYYPVRVTRHGDEVTIWFCCPVTGFRAFHLSAVLAVGRGRSGVAAGSETATVVLETEDAA